MPMLQPVASTSPCTVPGLMSAAVRLMLSRTKPVGVQAATAPLDAQIVRPNTANGNAKRECNFMTSLPVEVSAARFEFFARLCDGRATRHGQPCQIAAD